MQNSDKLAIGERVRNSREAMELSREQMAEILNISTIFLRSIECGQRGISMETLMRLCSAMNVSADYILFGRKENLQIRETISEEIAEMDERFYPEVLASVRQCKKLIALVNKKSSKN